MNDDDLYLRHIIESCKSCGRRSDPYPGKIGDLGKVDSLRQAFCQLLMNCRRYEYLFSQGWQYMELIYLMQNCRRVQARLASLFSSAIVRSNVSMP